MGKKYDAYAQAAQAETASLERYKQDPTEQNARDAQQATANADFLWAEVSEDPQG